MPPRFDLILLLMDKCGEEWDEAVSTFVLEGSILQDQRDHKQSKAKTNSPATPGGAASSGGSEGGGASAAASVPFWGVEKLQKYVAFVKDAYQPKLTSDAMAVLERYYQVRAKSEERQG